MFNSFLYVYHCLPEGTHSYPKPEPGIFAHLTILKVSPQWTIHQPWFDEASFRGFRKTMFDYQRVISQYINMIHNLITVYNQCVYIYTHNIYIHIIYIHIHVYSISKFHDLPHWNSHVSPCHLDVSRPDGSTIVAMVPDTAELGMPRGYPILRSGLHIDIGLTMIYIII